ncbi:MaoC family dehydratase [Azospirillum sp. TSO22-1]|uniref:MaoC family dehydratase n=1 Tax=Azospirillum sp. TSO22-1 TaxID=716789 RepID=UPI000D61CAEB|nr:MaoC family dehydratase [Azospirillum sp. TSO22-1]PWC53033.1 acyl dehydratase [Azospirillum sp. TSO22-1]
MAGRWFEEFSVGDVIETRGVTVTESQIIDFALMFDPQSFHIDGVAAAEGPFGGLIASGFQTLGLTFRLLLATGVLDGTSLGSGAMDEVRWLRPVRPGDTLRVRVEVVGTRPSRRGDRGVVRCAYATTNQHGEPVLTCAIDQIIAARPSATVAV